MTIAVDLGRKATKTNKQTKPMMLIHFFTLKVPAKKASENSVCFIHLLHIVANIILTYVSKGTNSVDPDQTTGAV